MERNLIDSTYKYALDIVNKKYVAGITEINGCKRHLEDLEKSKDEDFPYYYDPEKAKRVIKFFGYMKHVKGALRGQYIELAPFQKFILGSIYGWRRKDDHTRRFRIAYNQVGRKNAKSTLTSGMANYEIGFSGTLGAEVYCTATKRDQAKIVFDDARLMAEGSKDLRKRLRVTRDLIYYKKENGKCLPLSKDAKTADGFSPSFGILDEYHEHKTSEMYDVLLSGMGQREEPLLWIITTAGFNLTSPCYKEYEYAKQVVNGIVENDEYFVYIAELDKDDEITDPEVFAKANPLLRTAPKMLKYLKSQLKLALDNPEKMRNFLTKNLNKWVAFKENSYIDMDKFKKNIVDVLPSIKRYDSYVGVDLSSKIDITAVGTVTPIEDGKFVFKAHCFMPEDVVHQKQLKDKVPYSTWVDMGLITLTPGDVVDYDFIEWYIENDIDKKTNVEELDYDPWNATQFANSMQDKGYEAVEIRQGYATLSEPLKVMREEIYKGNIIYEKNPLMIWMFSNAVVKMDSNENIMLNKEKSINRIDIVIALVCAFSRAMYAAENGMIDLNEYLENDILDKFNW